MTAEQIICSPGPLNCKRIGEQQKYSSSTSLLAMKYTASGYSTYIDQAGNKALTEGFLCWREVSTVHWRSDRSNGHTFR